MQNCVDRFFDSHLYIIQRYQFALLGALSMLTIAYKTNNSKYALAELFLRAVADWQHRVVNECGLVVKMACVVRGSFQQPGE